MPNQGRKTNRGRKRVEYDDPIEELKAIRLVYGLSVEQLCMEMKEGVGIVSTTLHRALKTGRTKRTTVKAILLWLRSEGRRKFPLYMKGVGS